MDARGAAQDADGSRRTGDAGLRFSRFGRRFSPAARRAVPAVRLPDADRRQPHQRPLGLPQRLRRQRPAGPRTGLRTGLDHTPRHASRNRPDDRGRLHHGLRTALLRRLVADRRRRAVRRVRIPLHGGTLSAGLPRVGRPAGAGLLRIRPRRLYQLRSQRQLDMADGRHFGGLRTGDRHPADGQQLPRPRAGRPQRQTHARRPAGRTGRQRALSGTGIRSRNALPPAALRRPHRSGSASPALPRTAHGDMAAHGADRAAGS